MRRFARLLSDGRYHSAAFFIPSETPGPKGPGVSLSHSVMAGLEPAIHVLSLDPRIALSFASLVRGWN